MTTRPPKAPFDTPLGWQRVKDLFHLALERDPATRGAYLDQACEGDADLRREVDSLIAAHGRVGTFIGEPVGTPDGSRSGRAAPFLPLPSGSRIGPYKLIELLGAGGMGEVYRARDSRLARDVALKVLPPDLAADPDRRERFLREARVVSALNHPNICTIYEVGTSGSVDFICFEYIEGQTLASLLDGPTLSLDRVLEVSLPLVDALAYAHGKRILHRDLKPANIMISERGPKILDFGLAKVFAGETGRDSRPSLTNSGLVMGTVAYMSPEQALGRKVDERSDIFSLGAVLYEMASGKQAFVGNTPTEVIDAVLHQDPAPLVHVRPELPAGLSLVVEQTLRKDAAARYQSMADLALDLRRLSEPDGRRLIAAAPRRDSAGGTALPAPPAHLFRRFTLALPSRVTRVLTIPGVVLGLLAAFWVGGRWRTGPEGAPLDAHPAVTRSVIELPASAPLGLGTATIGFDATLVTLSPDGRWLVYVGESGGVSRLYRRALDRFDEPQPIPGTEGAVQAFFSPDSRNVGFLTDDKVKRVSLEGDDLRTLCPALSPSQGNWTRDDTIFFANDEGGALWRVPASGGGGRGEAIDVPRRPGFYIRFADALPDGKTILVTAFATRYSGGHGVISLFDTQSQRLKALVESGYDPRYVPPGYLVFARSGNLMAVAFDAGRGEVQGEPATVLRGVATDTFWGHAQFAFSASGSVVYAPGTDRAIGRLARVDRLGHVDLLPAEPKRYGVLDLSPDGTKLAVQVFDVIDYVWIWDLRRNEGRRISGRFPAGWPVWGPDGREVAFDTSESRQPQDMAIQSQPVGGPAPARTLLQGGFLRVLSWVGTKISVSESRDRTRSGILPASGTAPVEWDERPCRQRAISPDGHWMACHERMTGQVSIRSFTDRTLVRQVSSDGGMEPRWCGTCGMLFFRKGNRWLATSVSFEPELHWDPPRTVFETDFVDTNGVSYDVSPDGRYLYVVKSAAEDERRKLHLVTGWTEELRTLGPVQR